MPVPENIATIAWAESKAEGWTALARGMSSALSRQGVPVLQKRRSEVGLKVARACKRIGVTRRIAPLGKRRLVTLSWASDLFAFPDAFWCEIIPWCFDCWGQMFGEWETMLRRHRVRLAFFSAQQTAAHFAKAIPGLTTHWLPEAQELGLLKPGKPLAERSVHVFEMGRRLAAVHDQIRDPLKSAGKTHIYDPPNKHATAIPGLDALYQKMGDSAIVMCYPKVMTHPEGAGGVETVTQRYLETIGSGCLPVGHCPKELEELMGFNPVVELSPEDPAGHMLEVLAKLPSYQPQVDRAFRKIQEWGGFDPRARRMLDLIGEFDRSRAAR